jgi:hypothetical protein
MAENLVKLDLERHNKPLLAVIEERARQRRQRNVSAGIAC